MGAWQFAAASPEAREAGGVLTKQGLRGERGDIDDDDDWSSMGMDASPS